MNLYKEEVLLEKVDALPFDLQHLSVLVVNLLSGCLPFSSLWVLRWLTYLGVISPICSSRATIHVLVEVCLWVVLPPHGESHGYMSRRSIRNRFVIWFECLGSLEACILAFSRTSRVSKTWSNSLWIHSTSHSYLVINIHYKSFKGLVLILISLRRILHSRM